MIFENTKTAKKEFTIFLCFSLLNKFSAFNEKKFAFETRRDFWATAGRQKATHLAADQDVQ